MKSQRSLLDNIGLMMFFCFYFSFLCSFVYSVSDIEFISFNVTSFSLGKAFNFSVNVTCLYNECQVFNLSLYMSIENYIYVANQEAGLDVYSVNESGHLNFKDSSLIEASTAFTVYGDENYVYLANGADGIDVYSVNESGHLNQVYNSPLHNIDGYTYGIWKDSKFLYIANGNAGLEVYSVNESGQLSYVSGNYSGGFALSVWGDGNYIFLASGHTGIDVYSIDDNGDLTHTDNDDRSYTYDVWGDGNFIYSANDQDGIDVYSVNESGQLIHRDNDYIDGYTYGIWGNGDYLYVANGFAGLDVYSVNESGHLTHLSNRSLLDSNGEAYDVWGNGDYLYLADGESGVEVYFMESDGNITFLSTHPTEGYTASIWGNSYRKKFITNETIPFSKLEEIEDFDLVIGESKIVNFNLNATGQDFQNYTIYVNLEYYVNGSKINSTLPFSLFYDDIEQVASQNFGAGNHKSSNSSVLGSNQTCTYDNNFDWGCLDWGNCIIGIQKRVCKNKNNCGNIIGKPLTTRKCEMPIEKPSKLFDIQMDLLNSELKNSDELETKIKFESFGNVLTVVDLIYDIFDSNNNLVYHEVGSVQVETEQSIVKDFKNLNLSEGSYTLVLTTLYGNGVKDEFRKNFVIGEGKNSVKMPYKTIISSFLTFSLILFSFYYLYNKIGGKK